MTFTARLTDRTAFGDIQIAEVQVTYGPITIVIEETVGDLRYFWSQLGELLKEEKAEERAEAALEETLAEAVSTGDAEVFVSDVPEDDDDAESVAETEAILADPETMAAIAEAEAESTL